MNIIEFVKSLLQEFPKINDICNNVHIDFTSDIPTSYGLSPTGDTLLREDILGNQLRQHTFALYAVYQSINDYDRLANSGTLLELQMYLESKADNQQISINVGDKTITGNLEKLTCSNGMLFSVPQENMTDGREYQLQIIAEYTTESEDF